MLNYLDHTNWVSVVEMRKQSAGQMDNILGNEQNETETYETTDMNAMNDLVPEETKQEQKAPSRQQKKKIGGKWGVDDEEEEEDPELLEIEKTEVKVSDKSDIIDLTIPQEDPVDKALRNSAVPGVQLSLNNVKQTFILLKSQLGITNSQIEKLKGIMRDVYTSSFAQFRLAPCGEPTNIKLRQLLNGKVMPTSIVKLERLENMLNTAFDHITNAEVEEASYLFLNIIHLSVFFIASSKEETSRVRAIVSICTEYLLMLKLNAHAEENKSDKVKFAEICLQMTVCKLAKPIHLFLMLKKAKIASKNIKNYLTAVSVLYKLLALKKDLEEYEDISFDKFYNEYETFQKVGKNDKNLSFNLKEIEDKESKEVICAYSLEILDQNRKKLACPLCLASYSEASKGVVCKVCELCKIGEEVLGLRLSDEIN